MERERVVAGIRTAFAGVTLGAGVSLRQAQAADGLTDHLTEAEFRALLRTEVTDDWSLVSDAELRDDGIAFLDHEGLRYYLPAFLLWLLDHHDEDDSDVMAVIGTMSVIAPGKELRAERYAMLDGWTPDQRSAIAAYVEALPRLIELDYDEPTLVERAIRDYWGRFLPRD